MSTLPVYRLRFALPERSEHTYPDPTTVFTNTKTFKSRYPHTPENIETTVERNARRYIERAIAKRQPHVFWLARHNIHQMKPDRFYLVQGDTQKIAAEIKRQGAETIQRSPIAQRLIHLTEQHEATGKVIDKFEDRALTRFMEKTEEMRRKNMFATLTSPHDQTFIRTMNLCGSFPNNVWLNNFVALRTIKHFIQQAKAAGQSVGTIVLNLDMQGRVTGHTIN